MAQMERTVKGARNHPSVITHSVSNELSFTPDRKAGTRRYLIDAVGEGARPRSHPPGHAGHQGPARVRGAVRLRELRHDRHQPVLRLVSVGRGLQHAGALPARDERPVSQPRQGDDRVRRRGPGRHGRTSRPRRWAPTPSRPTTWTARWTWSTGCRSCPAPSTGRCASSRSTRAGWAECASSRPGRNTRHYKGVLTYNGAAQARVERHARPLRAHAALQRARPQLQPPGRVYYLDPSGRSLRPAVPDQGTPFDDHAEPPTARLRAADRAGGAAGARDRLRREQPAVADPGRPRASWARPARTSDAAAAELEDLGVDILRTNVIYNKIYRTPTGPQEARRLRHQRPNSRHYDWSATDRLVAWRKANGMQVLMTVTGPGPVLQLRQPVASAGSCRAPTSRRPPSSSGFAAAVAKRYRGKVDYYSIWNEPNIGKTWLTPRFEKRRGVGTIDYAAAKYRQLYLAGLQGRSPSYDPARRNRVLFGETAAISAPIPFLRAALCLDSQRQAVPRRPRPRPGLRRPGEEDQHAGLRRTTPTTRAATAPRAAGAGPRRRSRSPTCRACTRLIDGAARRGRIARGRGVYVTEFGYQSNPPDRISNVSPAEQAQYINESDRLFYGDQPREVGGPVRAHRRPAAGPVQLGPAVRGRQAQARLRGLPDADRGHPPVGQLGRGLRPGRGPADRPPWPSSRRPPAASSPPCATCAPTRSGMFRVNISKKDAFKLKWRLCGISNTNRRDHHQP